MPLDPVHSHVWFSEPLFGWRRLALVGAGPVYRLLGKKDVGATVLPVLDAPLISGSLGFLYHTGKHTITEADWKAFFEFTGRHFE